MIRAITITQTLSKLQVYSFILRAVLSLKISIGLLLMSLIFPISFIFTNSDEIEWSMFIHPGLLLSIYLIFPFVYVLIKKPKETNYVFSEDGIQISTLGKSHYTPWFKVSRVKVGRNKIFFYHSYQNVNFFILLKKEINSDELENLVILFKACNKL